jgi:polyribonucleotide nucleotidyltransferase
VAPVVEENQKPVQFKLEQLDTPEKIVAVLYNHTYIPEFLPAVQAFKKKTSLEATVTKITPFGVYVSLYEGKITSKLALNDLLNKKISDQLIQVGTVLSVVISHLSADRIVVVLEPKSEG